VNVKNSWTSRPDFAALSAGRDELVSTNEEKNEEKTERNA